MTGSDDFGITLQLAYSDLGRSSGIGPFDRCLSVPSDGREIFDPPRLTFDLPPTDNLHEKGEIVTENWLPVGPTVVRITAGASSPNNLIEETFSVSTNCERSPRTSEPGFGRLKKRGSPHYYFSVS
jgi:hypothetical protein